MRTHTVKSWPHQFEAVISGRKKAELRKNDRDYKVGDFLILKEFDRTLREPYTGRVALVQITHLLDKINICAVSKQALNDDYAILSIRLVIQDPMYWDGNRIYGFASSNSQSLFKLDPVEPWIRTIQEKSLREAANSMCWLCAQDIPLVHVKDSYIPNYGEHNGGLIHRLPSANSGYCACHAKKVRELLVEVQ